MILQRINVVKQNEIKNLTYQMDMYVPDQAGNYKLSCEREDGAVFDAVGTITVDDKERVYQLKLGLSDGSQINAGTFITQVTSPVTEVYIPHTGSSDYTSRYYITYVCRDIRSRPIVKYDGEIINTYADLALVDNPYMHYVELPTIKPGQHTVTLEGGHFCFGNYQYQLPMPSDPVSVLIGFENEKWSNSMGIAKGVSFGTNYGDALGAGGLYGLCTSPERTGTLKVPARIKKIGKNALYFVDTPLTIYLHNQIEYADTISNSTYILASSVDMYFPYEEDTPVLFEPSTLFVKGTSKITATYNVYTNNSTIKEKVLLNIDEYTMVNVYRYDGSSWE